MKTVKLILKFLYKYIFITTPILLSTLFYLLNEYMPFHEEIVSSKITFRLNNIDVFEFSGIQFIIILMLVFGFFIELIRHQNHNKKILFAKLQQANNTIRESSEQFVDKFAEVFKYQDTQTLKEAMQEYVDESTYVIGAQLYKYTFKNKTRLENYKLRSYKEIKINQKESVVIEQENLNAVVQAYYRIPLNAVFNPLKNALYSLDEVMIKKFIESKTEILKNRQAKKSSNVTLQDIMLYNSSILATEILSMKIYNMPIQTIELMGVDSKRYNFVKRTGLLKTILNGELYRPPDDVLNYYVFKYEADGDNSTQNKKEKRIYIGRTFKYKGNSHLLLLIINSDIFLEEDGESMLFEQENKLSEILSEKNIELG